MSFEPEWTETSALMAAIAGLGGGLAALGRQYLHSQPVQWGKAIVEVCISLFAGLLVFWVADSVFHQPHALCASFTALAGYLGHRSFEMADSIVQLWLQRHTHNPPPPPPPSQFPPKGGRP